MILSDVFGSVDIEAVSAQPYLDAHAASASMRTASLVLSESGEHVSILGSSKGLGNDLDLRWLIALRRRAMLIVTSIKTANAESYQLPKRASLLLLGRKTRLRVPRIEDGDNRLIVTGKANTRIEIPNVRWLQSDDIETTLVEILQSIGPTSAVNFEFGKSGLNENIGAIDSIFVSSRASVSEVHTFGLPLSQFELMNTIRLHDLSLSWWERRGNFKMSIK